MSKCEFAVGGEIHICWTYGGLRLADPIALHSFGPHGRLAIDSNILSYVDANGHFVSLSIDHNLKQNHKHCDPRNYFDLWIYTHTFQHYVKSLNLIHRDLAVILCTYEPLTRTGKNISKIFRRKLCQLITWNFNTFLVHSWIYCPNVNITFFPKMEFRTRNTKSAKKFYNNFNFMGKMTVFLYSIYQILIRQNNIFFLENCVSFIDLLQKICEEYRCYWKISKRI